VGPIHIFCWPLFLFPSIRNKEGFPLTAGGKAEDAKIDAR